MNNKIIVLLLAVITSVTLSAQHKLKGHVYDTHNNPIIGANLIWEKSKKGTVTDTNGYFEIETPKGHEHLIVSYLGYVTQSVHVHHDDEPLSIILEEDTEILDEVVISRRATGTVHQRGAIVQTQRVGLAELRRDACCNLGESFNSNASVDVAYSDATTGARQIKLLGLSGTYVQMLTENYPNFRGAAAAYGMDYIPGSWMDGIYISKGTSSVKNGYEALAGQINVEYKKPHDMDKLALNVFADDATRVEANADASIHFNEDLRTGFFAHYSKDLQSHDRNNDTFLDTPLKEQMNLMNRWEHNVGNYAAQYGVKYIYENRLGGQDTRHHQLANPYQIDINTHRGEFYTKQAYNLVNHDHLMTSTALIASGSLHEQKSMYDATAYNIKQKNLYLSLIFEKEFSHAHHLSTGLSLNHDGFNETLAQTSFDRKETVSGAYVQYTYNLHDKLILLGGVRADYSNLYGFFFTPRFHIKYNPQEWIHLRASAGKGFRTANVLAENNYLLASSRKVDIADNLAQEEAWNAGMNVTFYIPITEDKQLTIVGEYYHTRFLQQVVVDVESDAHTISFYNLDDGTSYSNSAQVEVSYPFFEGFTLTAAYRYTRSMSDYRNPVTGETRFLKKALTNDYKGLVTASYQTKSNKWQLDATLQMNGGGRMPTPDAVAPLWNETFEPFSIVNTQITRNFKNFSIYAGSENLFDFRQEYPIIGADNPRGNDFDATMVWGPVHGRKIYVGLRYNIPRI